MTGAPSRPMNQRLVSRSSPVQGPQVPRIWGILKLIRGSARLASRARGTATAASGGGEKRGI